MNTISDSLSGVYPATREAIPRARRDVTRLAVAAGFSGEPLDRVRLALTEAVTNVVRHAYRGDSGHVEVTARTFPGELWILVADEGCGYQRPCGNPGLGFGLALMADASEDFVIAERAEGGTEVQLQFRLTASRSL